MSQKDKWGKGNMFLCGLASFLINNYISYSKGKNSDWRS